MTDLADLSDVEKEALSLLRRAPLFSEAFGSGALKGDERRVEQALIGKGLVEPVPALSGFVRLTAEGLRLQAELRQEGSGG